MKPIVAGETAPNFKLKDNRGELTELNSYKGSKVLLSWHPLSWTKICGEQLVSLEANLDNFKRCNTVPLSLSVDPYPAKNAWAKHLQVANVKLLSDFWPHGGVAVKYGLFDIEEGFSLRANVIVDEHGKIIWVKTYDIAQLPDIDEVLAFLRR